MIQAFTTRVSARVLGVVVVGAALLCAGAYGVSSRATDARSEESARAAPPAARLMLTAAGAAWPEAPAAPVEASQPFSAAQGSQAAPQLILASGVQSRVQTQAQAQTMSPFRLAAATAAAESRALDCLTTAVYYEARGEGTDGMAAVAQVILNRVRHPLFPKSVCGVVYQGCQFSFVCGGMGGARNAALWARSREIAQGALSGEVMTRVGTATHFHATRINPRWAGLSRVATVGRHVFYAYSGRRGAPGHFLNVGDAGAPPAAAPRASEPPVYAMLPSEQPNAPAPVVSTVPQAPEAPVVTVAEAAAPSAPSQGVTPLENAPAAPTDPLTARSPVI